MLQTLSSLSSKPQLSSTFDKKQTQLQRPNQTAADRRSETTTRADCDCFHLVKLLEPEAALLLRSNARTPATHTHPPPTPPKLSSFQALTSQVGPVQRWLLHVCHARGSESAVSLDMHRTRILCSVR